MSHDDMITIYADILQVTDAAVLNAPLQGVRVQCDAGTSWR